MKRTIKGLLNLSRLDDFVWFILVTSILGVLAAMENISWRFIIVLCANWLSLAFAFMINDIEDAPEDAFSTKNSERNPISSGVISVKTARIAAGCTAFIAAGLYVILGQWPFVFGMAGLILGFLFSAQVMRLKTLPYFDVLTYGLVMGGLPFLSSYFTYADRFNQVWLWPFILVMSVSVYDRLHKGSKIIAEQRSTQTSEVDAYQGTVVTLGDRATATLMMVLIILVVLTGVVTFFLSQIIPGWVMFVMGLLVLIFMAPQFIRSQRDDGSRSPALSIKVMFERAAALALMLNFFLPWLNDLFQLGLF